MTAAESPKHEPRLRTARTALILAATVCLVLTPSFAMAYYRAYGYGIGESPPGWLEAVDWPTWISGPDRISTYNRLGVVFGFALLAVVVALARLVGLKAQGRRQRRGWWLILGGLGAVAAGSLLEYGIPEDVFDPSNGFALELLGFLGVAIGTVVLGIALHRESNVAGLESAAIALIGPIGIVGGTAIVGHLPSGPASLLLLTAIAIGITGRPISTRSVRREV